MGSCDAVINLLQLSMCNFWKFCIFLVSAGHCVCKTFLWGWGQKAYRNKGNSLGPYLDGYIFVFDVL